MASKDNLNLKERTCSFCGELPDLDEGRILIEGLDGSYICTDCVDECYTISKGYRKKKRSDPIAMENLRPSKILEYLNQYVVNQDYAKMVLSVAVYNHYKLLEHKEQKSSDIELEKSNICLVGPTGSGKTYLLKTIAKMLDVPFAMTDATSLTAAGYVGQDPESVIKTLLENADGDVEKAQRGIVYIDEIDKLSRKSESPSRTRDVGGEDVQQALLKIIEGTEVEVPAKGRKRHPLQDTVKIDTSNILFIVGGSFEGIDEIIKERQNKGKSAMGFGANVESPSEKSFNDYILDVKAEDLRKFGMLPELIGRLPIICPLQELDVDSLVKILTEPKNAIIKQYQELMMVDGVELEFTKEAVEAIAKEAIKRKTGARSLRSILEEVLLSHMFSAPDEKDLSKIIITEDVVLNKAEPVKEYNSKKKIEA